MDENQWLPGKIWLPDEIKEFADIASPAVYRKSSVLFWQGDSSDRVFFIESGQVCVYHYTKNGNTITLLLHEPGELVGIGSLLRGTVREVYAKTIGPSTLWEIGKDDFFRMLNRYPKIAIWIASQLAERLHKTDMVVFRIASQDVNSRLIMVLRDLMIREKNNNGKAILRFTHQEISNMIGACRQTTTAALGKLRREGIINTGKGFIEVINVKELESLADK